jgi:hypothetical protein
MNLYSDVPQFFGCCDQSVRNNEHRIATYIVYSGEGTGSHDGEVAATWLTAYGISAVGVAGKSQLGQPFGNPRKFDGVLPEVWRSGEEVVYRVQESGTSLVHVVDRSAIVQRHPVNGIDIEPLQSLIAALDRPAGPASLRWLNQHEAEIAAETGPNHVLFVQETYDPGWHATESGTELEIAPDALNLMTIVPRGEGKPRIRLRYTGGPEDRIMRAAQIVGLASLVLWTLRARKRQEA